MSLSEVKNLINLTYFRLNRNITKWITRSSRVMRTVEKPLHSLTLIPRLDRGIHVVKSHCVVSERMAQTRTHRLWSRAWE